MTTTRPNTNIYFTFALIFAIWFILTSWFWVYYANLFISFPFGLASLILWYKGKKIGQEKRFNFVGILLLSGTALSIIALVCLSLFN
ncbi:MAG: hypothetical protein M3R17_06735 [Bacteroidota bacterium]|nr:hypothetical protein [Bacteroidota bacterium]